MEKGIKIWEDAWIQNCKVGKLNSPKPQGCQISKVSELISNFKWTTTLIFRTFSSDEARKILRIPISLAGRPDSYFWSHSNTGQYTVKPAYKAMTRQDRQMEKRDSNKRETSSASEKE